MRILRDYAELTSDESGFVLASAATFGFSPTREAWFRNAHDFYYEANLLAQTERDPASVPQVGWWTGWLDIGLVTEDDARAMAVAIKAAHAWFRDDGGGFPRTIDPFPAWEWGGLDRRAMDAGNVKLLDAMAFFLDGGAFDGSVRRAPYAVLLTR